MFVNALMGFKQADPDCSRSGEAVNNRRGTQNQSFDDEGEERLYLGIPEPLGRPGMMLSEVLQKREQFVRCEGLKLPLSILAASGNGVKPLSENTADCGEQPCLDKQSSACSVMLSMGTIKLRSVSG